MSYFSQMTQLAFHNFVSAAVGHGASRSRSSRGHRAAAPPARLGNFWADLVRGTLYVLLPLSLVLALLFVQQGVIQNFAPYLEVTTLEGAKQTHRDGPGREPGGDQAARHQRRRLLQRQRGAPVREPDAVDQLLVDVRDLRDPVGADLRCSAGWCGTSGTAGRSGRRCSCSSSPASPTAYWAEARGNPIHAERGRRRRRHGAAIPGGNMEGKEVRFGIANSALYATVTTAASCGAVNAMHDSFTPLGGLVPLVNMQLGEVIFGGVGAGLYGMLVMVVLTVFIAGLMVGRTPGVPRQEDPGARGPDGDALRPGLPGRRSSASPPSPPCVAAGLKGLQQRRAARPLGDPVRLLSTTGEQRQRLRRAHRLDLLLQHAARARDADRPLRDDRADARARPVPRRSSKIAPETAGTFPVTDAALRGAAGRRDPDRRRAHLLPRALARPDRRALPHAGAGRLF